MSLLLQNLFFVIPMLIGRKPVQKRGIGEQFGFFRYSLAFSKVLTHLSLNSP